MHEYAHGAYAGIFHRKQSVCNILLDPDNRLIRKRRLPTTQLGGYWLNGVVRSNKVFASADFCRTHNVSQVDCSIQVIAGGDLPLILRPYF